MLSGVVKMADDGTAFVETGMGPKVLGDYVKSWAASDGKDFVSPPTGGGAKPNEGRTKSTASPLAKVPGFADLPET